MAEKQTTQQEWEIIINFDEDDADPDELFDSIEDLIGARYPGFSGVICRRGVVDEALDITCRIFPELADE